jgi:hypothetical protein
MQFINASLVGPGRMEKYFSNESETELLDTVLSGADM